MKIPLSVLLEIAKSEGFTGKADDVAAMKKHLLEHPDGAVETIAYQGNDISVKDCEVDVPNAKPARKAVAAAGAVAAMAGAAAAAPQLPADFDLRVKTAAKAMLVEAGVEFKGDKIQLVRPGVVGKGKSGEERWFEARKSAGQNRFQDYVTTKMFGDWIGAKVALKAGNTTLAYQLDQKAKETHEQVFGKAMDTLSTTNGAATVPEVFMPDLIKLVNDYGMFRELTKVYETNITQLTLPRRTGGVTGYWPTQNTAITQSNPTYDNVTLNSQTLAVLCQSSMQLIQASGISVADEIADEIARSCAQIMDQCLLIGNGSATYGGMTGFDKKFGTAASDGGYVVVGGGSMDAHTHAQLVACISRLPSYAIKRGNCKWTCSRAAKGLIFDRLATSTNVGGLLKTEVTNNGPVTYYMGYPIIVNDVMNTTNSVGASTYATGFTAGAAPDVLFGDFEQASKMLLFKSLAIDTSSDRYFDQYAMAFRGVVQFDVNVHDVGNSTTAGPVVSFWQS